MWKIIYCLDKLMAFLTRRRHIWKSHHLKICRGRQGLQHYSTFLNFQRTVPWFIPTKEHVHQHFVCWELLRLSHSRVPKNCPFGMQKQLEQIGMISYNNRRVAGRETVFHTSTSFFLVMDFW